MLHNEQLSAASAGSGEDAQVVASAEEDCAVQVAVHVRPLIGSEQEAGCQESLAVTPGVPQVSQPHEHVHVNMHWLIWPDARTS